MKYMAHLIVCVMSVYTFLCDAWQPAPAPLMTKFSANVKPDQIPKYPRPELYRNMLTTWASLNGLWQVDYNVTDLNNPPFGKNLKEEILVPYPIESPLSGLRKLTTNYYMFYRRVFPASTFNCSTRGHTLLHFEAVDWNTTVWIDGRKLGSHSGGYDPFSFDISHAILKNNNSTPVEIIVGIFDPTDDPKLGDAPIGKQSIAAFHDKARGNRYVPTSGIWQTVWIECVPNTYIQSITPIATVNLDPLSSSVNFEMQFQKSNDAVDILSLSIFLPKSGDLISTTNCSISSSNSCSNITVPISGSHTHLWEPTSPLLYTFTASLTSSSDSDVIDQIHGHFLLRKIEVSRDNAGVPRPFLNGQPIYMMATLDQGFWPDGAYSAPTDEALLYDLQVLKKLGYNTVRKHVKVEPRRWYYYCDMIGLMVWQDFVSPNKFKKPITTRMQQLQLNEGMAMIQSRQQFGSIVAWVTFNEGWGQADANETKYAVNMVRSVDSLRLIDGCTGCNAYGAGDTIDQHHYSPPGCPNFDNTTGHLMYASNGEYGGVELALSGHEWIKGGCHGYAAATNASELTHIYEQYAEQIVTMIHTKGLSASVYTQTSDCERECNGVLTYDRIVKPIVSRWQAANQKVIKAISYYS